MNVVESAAQVGEIDEELTRFLPGKRCDGGPDFFIFDRAGKAVAANHETVAGLKRIRSADVSLHFRLWAQGPHDHVRRNVAKFFGAHLPLAGKFPLQAMIERELIDVVFTDAVATAVADVTDVGAFREQREGGRGRSHSAKLEILHPLGMNDLIRKGESRPRASEGSSSLSRG